MQNSQRILVVFLLVMLNLLGYHSEVYAEQGNSAKDCIENPDKCTEDSLSPQKIEDKQIVENDKGNQVGLSIWDFIRMIFATLFVIALLYFLLKFLNKRSKRYRNTQLVQNLGGTSVGANKSVQIIKVGNRVFIVGVGDDVQLLAEIKNEEEAQQIIAEYNNKLDQLSGASDFVTKLIERTRAMIKNENKKEQHSSFPSVFKEELEEMSNGRKKLYEELKKKGTDAK